MTKDSKLIITEEVPALLTKLLDKYKADGGDFSKLAADANMTYRHLQNAKKDPKYYDKALDAVEAMGYTVNKVLVIEVIPPAK